MKNQRYKIAILGAGPAGLGAGYHLSERNAPSWRIFEADGRVGGLSSSRVDKNGFTWDLGGHVIFSSSEKFNFMMEEVLGSDALTHKRNSFIRMGKRFIPFPLQNNIHRLPQRDMRACLKGMETAGKGGEPPRNFREWIYHTLGEGLAEKFMIPYNGKVWSYPLEKMGFGWIDGRVALPALGSVKRSIKTGKDELKWGGNAVFHFPLRGGTGGLFEKIAGNFSSRISLRAAATRIDPRKRKISLNGGTSVSYGSLITTVPLDTLVKKILTNPPEKIVDAARELRKNSGWVVGIGLNRRDESGKCWVYFPENTSPFYRVTYFSNYSPLNVPDIRRQSSFICEISYGRFRPLGGADIVEETLKGLIRTGLMRTSDRKIVATTWKMRLPYLYPIPAIGRDDALGTIEKYLHFHGIVSVGRFGGWRYERGNMDHSFMAGYEAASSLSS